MGGLDLYARSKPDRAQLGAINGIDASTRGTLYLDEFVLRNDATEIGPVGDPIKPDLAELLLHVAAEGLYASRLLSDKLDAME